MFHSNIESLILNKEKNQKEIEQFYTKELDQYINFKKVRLSYNFKMIYKYIGKDRYGSPEIIDELENRFNKYVSDRKREKAKIYLINNPKPIKPPKPIKVVIEKPFKSKVISVRQRVWELLSTDETLTNKQLNEIINANIKTVGTSAGYVRRILRRRKEIELKKQLKEQLEKELNKEVIEYLKEIPLSQIHQCRLYLFSVLNNW